MGVVMAKMPDNLREEIERRVRTLAPVPPAHRIFHAALGYHESAQRCFELREKDGPYTFLPMQGLVLHAFASELYLKTLSTLEKQTLPERGHDLNALFDRLDRTTQQMIDERYHARYEYGVLKEDLIMFARTFQDWRYSYEFTGTHEIDNAGIAQLASALYETCLEINPEFAQPGIVHDRLVARAQGVPIIGAPPSWQ
jgi:hypothetical protein